MKSINAIMLTAAIAALSATPLRSEDQKKEMACCCKDMEKMEVKMKAEAAAMDKLAEEMNASTGEKKMEAMAAIINKMVQGKKAMKDKMAGMKEKPKAEAKPEKKEKHDKHEGKVDDDETAEAAPAGHKH